MQARKSRGEKDLVFVRVVKGGLPVLFCCALEDVNTYGYATAENRRNHLKIEPEKYMTGLVAMTADGASVNFGIKTGLLT